MDNETIIKCTLKELVHQAITHFIEDEFTKTRLKHLPINDISSFCKEVLQAVYDSGNPYAISNKTTEKITH